LSFLLSCPFCGPRSVYEFRFGGENRQRPEPEADQAAWRSFVFWRTNAAGEQDEWWCHTSGCGQWFLARRNTIGNKVLETRFPERA
jgi:heterotetrameric sarcosine oxidase delta subunit